jgi:hypothetical protein
MRTSSANLAKVGTVLDTLIWDAKIKVEKHLTRLMDWTIS